MQQQTTKPNKQNIDKRETASIEEPKDITDQIRQSRLDRYCIRRNTINHKSNNNDKS